MKIITKKNGPAVTSNTLSGRLTHICVLAYVAWGIFALTFKLVTQGIRIFSLLCVEYVQIFYSINFYQLDGNDLYTLCKTLKKNSDARSFQFLKKTVIMENKFCKTISITDIEPITSILLLVASFGSKFNKLASETIVLASDWWT